MQLKLAAHRGPDGADSADRWPLADGEIPGFRIGLISVSRLLYVLALTGLGIESCWEKEPKIIGGRRITADASSEQHMGVEGRSSSSKRNSHLPIIFLDFSDLARFIYSCCLHETRRPS